MSFLGGEIMENEMNAPHPREPNITVNVSVNVTSLDPQEIYQQFDQRIKSLLKNGKNVHKSVW